MNNSPFGQDDETRREELLHAIEYALQKLTVQELEAIYYDMSSKNYIND